MTDDKKTTRRSVLQAAGAGIAASTGLAGVAAAGDDKGKGGGKGQVKIPIKHYSPPDRKKRKGCGKYKVLKLPLPAVCAHLREHDCDRIYWDKCALSKKQVKSRAPCAKVIK